MVLDARPMRGGKRVPVLAIGADGRAQIDLWCKRGEGQAAIAGDTITIIIGAMADEPCAPERTLADEDMIAALAGVTNGQFAAMWSRSPVPNRCVSGSPRTDPHPAARLLAAAIRWDEA